MTPKPTEDLFMAKVRYYYDFANDFARILTVIFFVDPVVSIVIRSGFHAHTLTLRTNVVTNPLTTPFNQVLSWLCQGKDYFTAAGE